MVFFTAFESSVGELVPCVLLSFDDEQILIWRGLGWKSMYHGAPISSNPAPSGPSLSGKTGVDFSKSKSRTPVSSPKMMSLWTRAIQSNRAVLLEETGLDPDALLKAVGEFAIVSQATEHSYPAVVTPDEKSLDPEEEDYSEDESYLDEEWDEEDADFSEKTAPPGSLAVDILANRLGGGGGGR